MLILTANVQGRVLLSGQTAYSSISQSKVPSRDTRGAGVRRARPDLAARRRGAEVRWEGRSTSWSRAKRRIARDHRPGTGSSGAVAFDSQHGKAFQAIGAAPPPSGFVFKPPIANEEEAATEFREWIIKLGDLLAAVPSSTPPTQPDFEGIASGVLGALDPTETVPARALSLVTAQGWTPQDPIEPIMAAPNFPQPMYAPLRDISQQLLLPGIGQVPADSVGLLEPNRAFIESYMVGLNFEMARQLLWNAYPTDQRGSYFRQFWDPTSSVPSTASPGGASSGSSANDPDTTYDIAPIHEWTQPLGENVNPANSTPVGVVLVVRGELLRRYPTTIIYASPAANGQPPTADAYTQGVLNPSPDGTYPEIYPLFRGSLSPDLTYVAFNLNEEEALTGAFGYGYFFVLQQHPTEPRFGPQNLPSPLPGDSASIASAAFVEPFRVAIHAESHGAAHSQLDRPGERARRGGYPGHREWNRLQPRHVGLVRHHARDRAHGRVRHRADSDESGRHCRRQRRRDGHRSIRHFSNESRRSVQLSVMAGPAPPTSTPLGTSGSRVSTSPNPEAALPGDVAAFALRNTAPLLLLPVRIETKFVDDPQAGQQLWVRIYPDQIAIDSHDETLTEAEWSLAQQYWSAPVWSEPPPFVEEPVAHQAWIDAQQAAWIALARALGPERAAYVANVTAPPGFDTWITAASNRHLGTIGGPGPLGTPVQPTPSASPLRATSWEKAPIAQALPTTWLVGLYQGGTLVLSARVNRSGTTLQAGVDPTPATSGSSTTQAAATAGIGWMTDFDQAVQAGMGVKISLSGLTAAEIQAGFDQVVVVGSTGLDARQGRLTLQQLLTAHRYTDGFSLIAQGTPTKNSTDSSAGYSRKPAPGYGDSFSAERQGPLINTAAGAGQLLDGHYLADALGIPRGVVAHTPLADGTDQPDAIAMATLLWPATGGYTIPYMLGYTLDSETFDGLRQFATTVLRARGPIPAFRVGTVAYGVLPVMSIVNPLPLSGIAYGQVPARVASLVQSARGLWLDSLYDPTAANSDPDEAILRVLSTDAGTCNLSAGYSMGPEQMSNFVQYVGIDQRPQWQQFYDEVVTQTAQQLTELRLPQGTAPAAIGTFLQTPTASGLPIAADGDPANLASLTTTAVSQLLQSGTSASPSILDLLAWRAVLLEYASVAAEILGTSLSEPEYLTVGGTSPFVFALTTPIFTPLSGWPSTIWEESLGDYLYRWMTTPGQAPRRSPASRRCSLVFRLSRPVHRRRSHVSWSRRSTCGHTASTRGGPRCARASYKPFAKTSRAAYCSAATAMSRPSSRLPPRDP